MSRLTLQEQAELAQSCSAHRCATAFELLAGLIALALLLSVLP